MYTLHYPDRRICYSFPGLSWSLAYPGIFPGEIFAVGWVLSVSGFPTRPFTVIEKASISPKNSVRDVYPVSVSSQGTDFLIHNEPQISRPSVWVLNLGTRHTRGTFDNFSCEPSKFHVQSNSNISNSFISDKFRSTQRSNISEFYGTPNFPIILFFRSCQSFVLGRGMKLRKESGTQWEKRL